MKKISILIILMLAVLFFRNGAVNKVKAGEICLGYGFVIKINNFEQVESKYVLLAINPMSHFDSLTVKTDDYGTGPLVLKKINDFSLNFKETYGLERYTAKNLIVKAVPIEVFKKEIIDKNLYHVSNYMNSSDEFIRINTYKDYVKIANKTKTIQVNDPRFVNFDLTEEYRKQYPNKNIYIDNCISPYTPIREHLMFNGIISEYDLKIDKNEDISLDYIRKIFVSIKGPPEIINITKSNFEQKDTSFLYKILLGTSENEYIIPERYFIEARIIDLFNKVSNYLYISLVLLFLGIIFVFRTKNNKI